MLAQSLSPSRSFATPARELKDQLDSLCLLPLTGFERRYSELHPKQQKQIQPQRTHEMPVKRGGVHSASFQNRMIHFANHPDQAAETAEQVHGMGHRQNIEEGVAHVGGESESL